MSTDLYASDPVYIDLSERVEAQDPRVFRAAQRPLIVAAQSARLQAPALLSEPQILLRRGDERLLLVNFGADLPLASVPEPLFAPPSGTDWHAVWSSEDVAYGGSGRRHIETTKRFVLSAACAVLLEPGPQHGRTPAEDLAAWQALIG